MFPVCTKVDILFLIDDSSSVSYSGFTYAKSVAAKLVDCLTIGPDDVRVGMMKFGSTVSTRFTFSQFFDKNQIKSSIIGSSYRGDIRTYTYTPLQNALHLMTSNQADTLDIVIVLTDGKSNNDVVYASQALHSAGVYTFAMGIGAVIDSNNLQTIARNPNTDYHVSTNDYTDLHRKVSKLINGLCTGKAYLFNEIYHKTSVIFKNANNDQLFLGENGSFGRQSAVHQLLFWLMSTFFSSVDQFCIHRAILYFSSVV